MQGNGRDLSFYFQLGQISDLFLFCPFFLAVGATKQKEEN